MKKYASVLVVLCITIFMIGSFSGCGGKDDDNYEKPAAMVFIVGNHANAKRYSRDMLKDADEIIERCFVEDDSSATVETRAQISVLVSDGFPEQVSLPEEMISIRSNSDTQIDNFISSFSDNFIDYLQSDKVKANDKEVDLLEAISKAQNILREYPDCEHYIYILDTGFCTTGALNMNKLDIFDESKSNGDIISRLRDKGYLPRLEDENGIVTNIVFKGLGNVGDKQEMIKVSSDQTKFENFWTQLIESCGGDIVGSIRYNDSSASPAMMYFEDEDSEDWFPYVTPVIVNEIEINEDTPPYKTNVGFKSGRSELIDEEAAHTEIKKVVESLENFSGNLYVVGTIAKVNPDDSADSNNISAGRANVVANLLYNEGIAADRIIVIDAATRRFSWTDGIEFKDGSTDMDEKEAQKNRVVAIIPDNNKAVDELRAQGLI